MRCRGLHHAALDQGISRLYRKFGLCFSEQVFSEQIFRRADRPRIQCHNRDRLLIASAHHTAVHRKYGNPLDCANRFGAAFGVARLQ